MEQYRPQQATQGQFTPLAANAAPEVRVPTAPMTGARQFQTQNFESCALERKIIQLKDSEQSASSRTSPLPLQHQAEDNREAQFASIKFTPLVAGALALLGSLYFSSAGVGSAVARQATMSPIDTHRTGLY